MQEIETVVPVSATPTPTTKRCAFCGETIQFTAIRCKHYQADLALPSNVIPANIRPIAVPTKRSAVRWSVLVVVLVGLTITGVLVQRWYYPTDIQMAEHMHDLCVEIAESGCSVGPMKQAFAAGDWDCRNVATNMLEADRPLRRQTMRAESLAEVKAAILDWSTRKRIDGGTHPNCRPGNRLGFFVN